MNDPQYTWTMTDKHNRKIGDFRATVPAAERYQEEHRDQYLTLGSLDARRPMHFVYRYNLTENTGEIADIFIQVGEGDGATERIAYSVGQIMEYEGGACYVSRIEEDGEYWRFFYLPKYEVPADAAGV